VKTQAKFLLSSIFVLLPATGVLPLYAQTWSQYKDCGFPPALKMYTVDLDGRVNAATVEDLENGQNCLNENQIRLKTSVEDLHSLLTTNGDLETDILDLQNKLKQTEFDLHSAETKIETLENRLTAAEDEIQVLTFDSRVPPHPASGRATANKPKAPASMPTTEWDAQGNPIKPASKPKAPASKPRAPISKPKPPAKEGTQ